jgi:5-methylcytosine-specific restriction endonuclease McrA
MMSRACLWCDELFTTQSRTQRFCSKQHAGQYQYRNHVRRPHKWGDRPAVDAAHRKLRAELLPDALGMPCPMGCGRIMGTDAQLDHIVPRSQGGQSVRGNVRVVCRTCNHRMGSQLGARVAHGGGKTQQRRRLGL